MYAKLIIAEDQTLIAQLIKNLIENEFGKDVVAVASNGQEAVELALELEHDVLLVDIAMPKLDGVEVCERVIKAKPNARVMALSGQYDLCTMMRVMKARFMGFIDKHESDIQRIDDAIETVLCGGYAFSQAYNRLKAEKLVSSNAPHKYLTEKQISMLPLYGRGMNNQDIALALGISQHTVSTQRQLMRESLGLRSSQELMQYAIQNGFYRMEPEQPPSLTP